MVSSARCRNLARSILPERLKSITGIKEGSNFITKGLLASSGSIVSAKDILSLTSLAAWSISTPQSNLIKIVELPSREVESRCSILFTVATHFSRGSVTVFSTSAGPAPR
ncbi:hypothetical protein ES703_63346 [subsurface metagenome]